MPSHHSITPQTGHARALLNGTTIADTHDWLLVEGNVYFPPKALNSVHVSESTSHARTHCPWKGEASYLDVDAAGDDEMGLGFEGVKGGGKVEGAGWCYREPREGAGGIRDYVAFYKDKVDVIVD